MCEGNPGGYGGAQVGGFVGPREIQAMIFKRVLPASVRAPRVLT